MIKSSKIDGMIFNNSGVSRIKQDPSSLNRYAVIAKCGHCGSGYFIPIMFSVQATDSHDAIEVTKTIPRVKFFGDNRNNDYIISVFPITKAQSKLLLSINDHDNYLNNDISENEILERRVINLRQTSHKDSDLIDKTIPFKCAEEYDKHLVLQRQFAPTIQGNQIIVHNKFNKDILLKEYFTESLNSLGFNEENIDMFCAYWLIYNDKNNLNLSYSNGNLVQKNGKILKQIEVPDRFYPYMEKKKIGIEKDKKNEKERQKFYTSKQILVPSQIEKFNARLAKSQKFNDNEERQPGE